MAEIHHHHPYYIGADIALTEPQLRQAAACFEKSGAPADGVLGGRAAVLALDITGIGPVIIKHYTRGGLLRHVNRRTYVKISKFRCEAEFYLLQYLSGIGVNAPDPVAFAYKFPYFGGVLYHAWIITRKIENAVTLSRLSTAEPGRATAAMGEVARQMDVLIRNRIHHVDLHPGNVLVDDADRVFIIDFDKASTRPQNPARLQKKYVNRWNRAVVKHLLPESLLMADRFH